MAVSGKTVEEQCLPVHSPAGCFVFIHMNLQWIIIKARCIINDTYEFRVDKTVRGKSDTGQETDES
jgi:hypothetical protein